MPGKRGDLDFAMHVADELLSVLDYLSTRHLIHHEIYRRATSSCQTRSPATFG